MPIYLRQSTASQEIPLGYFVDSTDGNTEETALTIANTDIKLWKNGATTLANKNSGGATHISNGIYYAVLDATDTNTQGPMVIFCHPTGALAVRVECVVLTSNIFDSLIAGSDLFDVSVTQILGTACTAATAGVMDVNSSRINNVAATSVTTVNANLGTTQPINFTGTGASATAKSDVTNIATAAVSNSSAQLGVNIVNAAGTAWGSGAITAASIAASALNGKGDWNVGKTGYTLTATTGLGNQTANITGDLSGSVGSVTGAVGSVTAEVSANVTKVNSVAVTGSGTGIDPWGP